MINISKNDFKEFRQLSKELTLEAKSNPNAFITKIAQNLPKNMDVALYFNDDATEYLVLPYINDDFNTTEELNQQIIAGQANCLGCATTIATASTFSTVAPAIISTALTLSSASTAGTHGVTEVIQDNPVKNPAQTTALTDIIKHDIVKK